ncbi:NYN domain-containing protein [Afifella aestuarii]|uniref:LabA-like NYN domain-containing protein n=1 Tax=Afifella aestuarii TaxID=1909496 RepID=UPI000FE3B99F|nr:NYN domain-containing protein [Afifella aestuarii]
MFDAREKVALFLDGANLYATSRSLGFDIDYRRLLDSFRKKAYVLRAVYYTALAEDQEYSSIRPLIDWLDYNGYRIVTKPLKEFTDAQGRRKVKGNMDIELAVDAMEIAEHIDHLILFSGDGDFRYLVDALQRKGKKVTVASTLKSQPPMISDDLRRQADHFLELADMAAEFGRAGPARTRPASDDENDGSPGSYEDDEFDYYDDDDEVDTSAR